MNGSNQVPLIQTGEMPDGTPIFHSLSKDWSEALDLPSLNSSVFHLDLSSVSQITIPFLITHTHFLWFFACSQIRTSATCWGFMKELHSTILSTQWINGSLLSLFLDPKHGKSSVVSSLDCLSSIVERISTDNSTCPILPPAEAVAEGSPCSPQEGANLSDSGAQIPSPTNCTPLPQESSSSSSSNPIYQVL